MRRFAPSRTVTISWCVLLLFQLSSATYLFGQTSPRRTADRTPFTRFVPAFAGLYVNVSQLGEVNEALHRVGAWRWLPLVGGVQSGDAFPADLQQAVSKLVSAPGFMGARDLMHAEVGIIAASPSELDQALWLVRVPDDQATNRWFPEKRRTAQTDFGLARSFRMDDGLIVCERDGIVALAREWEGNSLVLSTMYLLRGRSRPVLEDDPTYRRAKSYLPGRPLATLYAALGREADIAAEGSDHRRHSNDDGASIAPTKRKGLIAALYEEDGGLNIAVRGASSAPDSSPALTAKSIERLLQLPQTTLLAVAYGVDWAKLLFLGDSDRSGGSWDRYVSFLLGGGALNSEGLKGLGSTIVFAWDQNLRPGTTPQAALLIESKEPDATFREVRSIIERLRQLVAAIDSPTAAQSIQLVGSVHLGKQVICAPLKRYAEISPHPFARLLSQVEPCWAVSGEWLIVTLGRDHLERILDAEQGLAPPLSSMRDATTVRQRRSDVRFVALVQGELASEVMDEWLADAQRGRSLLADEWWENTGGIEFARKNQVGIAMRVRQEPGIVVVGRVYPNTAADGRLVPGDRILGVDGSLLALQEPNADLRARIGASPRRPGPVLRVLREGVSIDVLLPLDQESATLPALGVSPTEALREIASVLRSLPIASVVYSDVPGDHYAARINLRFASDKADAQIPPE